MTKERENMTFIFELDNVREKVYYYAINEKKLREQGDIHKRVIAQVKAYDENTWTTYGIYPTQYDEDYVYCIAYSSIIQEKSSWHFLLNLI